MEIKPEKRTNNAGNGTAMHRYSLQLFIAFETNCKCVVMRLMITQCMPRKITAMEIY